MDAPRAINIGDLGALFREEYAQYRTDDGVWIMFMASRFLGDFRERFDEWRRAWPDKHAQLVSLEPGRGPLIEVDALPLWHSPEAYQTRPTL